MHFAAQYLRHTPGTRASILGGSAASPGGRIAEQDIARDEWDRVTYFLGPGRQRVITRPIISRRVSGVVKTLVPMDSSGWVRSLV